MLLRKPALRLIQWLNLACAIVVFSPASLNKLWSQELPVPTQDAPSQDAPTQDAPGESVAQKAEIDDEAEENDESTALLRGPVHEAFAEQFSADTSSAEVVEKEPPEPIDELPPDFKPEGENIQWIPGYWGWEIETEDFVWVTGLWRNVPPNQQWIPGYWSQVEASWMWVSGFWTSTEQEELVYLPVPPPAIDNGPSSEAPAEDYFWIPGSWQYSQNEYNWQAGYWAQGQDDWIWIPNRYVWTPSGCIYRNGYWDFVVESRGTVFCPMTFRPGYSAPFRPRYVVETGPLWLANLFVMPGCNHYGFGNYYGYRGNRQIYPWVNYYQRSRGYDPLFAYYAYQPRNANLMRQLGRVEQQIAANPQYRAQATVAAQFRANQNLKGPQANWALKAVSLQRLATQSGLDFDSPFQFAQLDAQQRRKDAAGIKPARQFASQRRDLEHANSAEDKQRADRVGSKVEANANQTERHAAKPVADANASGNVKRLAISKEASSTGKGRQLAAVTASASTNKTNANRPDASQGGVSQSEKEKAKTSAKNGNAGADTRADNPRPNASEQLDSKAQAQTNDKKADKPSSGQANSEQRNVAGADQGNRNDLTKNPLDRLKLDQTGNDKASPEDARELRDMMRRTSRAAAGNAASDAAKSAKAGAGNGAGVSGSREGNRKPGTDRGEGAGKQDNPASALGNSGKVPKAPNTPGTPGTGKANTGQNPGGQNRGTNRGAGNSGSAAEKPPAKSPDTGNANSAPSNSPKRPANGSGGIPNGNGNGSSAKKPGAGNSGSAGKAPPSGNAAGASKAPGTGNAKPAAGAKTGGKNPGSGNNGTGANKPKT